MRLLEGHKRYVECVAFAPDGASLATGSADGTARLWRTSDGACRETLDFEGHTVGAVGFSPEGRLLAVGTYGGDVREYALEPDSLRPLMHWQGQGRIVAVHYSPDGSWFGWAGYRNVVICDRRRGNASSSSQPSYNQFCLRFAPDGATFARGGESPLVQILHSDTQRAKHRFRHEDAQGCWSLAYSADGRSLVMALGGAMQVWDVPERRCVQVVREHAQVVSCIALSADGTRLITGSWDSVVHVYSFETATRRVGLLLGEFNWELGKLFDVALSPDGTLAAVAGHDGVALWDVE